MRTRQEKNKKIQDEITKEKHQKRMKKVVKIISIILNNICGWPKESNTKTESDKSKIK